MPTERKPLDNPNLSEALRAAGNAGRYLVAVWRVEDGMLVPHFTTHDFPSGDFEIAGRQLQAWGETEGKAVTS